MQIKLLCFSSWFYNMARGLHSEVLGYFTLQIAGEQLLIATIPGVYSVTR